MAWPDWRRSPTRIYDRSTPLTACIIIIIIIITIPMTVFIVLSSWPQVIARVHSVHLMNVEQRQAAADPQNKPPDLGCESACRQLSSTTTIAIYYYYSAWKLILIYRPTEGRRLSWPRHCRKGAHNRAQGCKSQWLCDKHNCPQRDSIRGPRALQSGMLPLDHCDLRIVLRMTWKV